MKPLIDIASECGVQFGESNVSKDVISRRQLESVVAAAIAQHQAKALEGVQAFEFDPPPYNSAAMGCGLEDRGITDRYEAMSYGWDEAMNRAAELVPDDFVSATAASTLQARIAELEDLSERLKLEAQAHAMEARTANSTIAEIYQWVTGSTGKPGNWRGAEPVRSSLAGIEQDAARYRVLLDLWNGRDMRELLDIEDFAAIDAARKESA